MILNDTISGSKLKILINNLETSSAQINSVVNNINEVIVDFK